MFNNTKRPQPQSEMNKTRVIHIWGKSKIKVLPLVTLKDLLGKAVCFAQWGYASVKTRFDMATRKSQNEQGEF